MLRSRFYPHRRPQTLFLMGVVLVGGCVGRQATFEGPDPTSRLNAIQDAVAEGDRSAIPRFIEQLDNPDPAVRLFAIAALERFTGQRMGYEPFASPAERAEAAGRWAAWYSSTVGGESADVSPAPGASAVAAPGQRDLAGTAGAGRSGGISP